MFFENCSRDSFDYQNTYRLSSYVNDKRSPLCHCAYSVQSKAMVERYDSLTVKSKIMELSKASTEGHLHLRYSSRSKKIM